MQITPSHKPTGAGRKRRHLALYTLLTLVLLVAWIAILGTLFSPEWRAMISGPSRDANLVAELTSTPTRKEPSTVAPQSTAVTLISSNSAVQTERRSPVRYVMPTAEAGGRVITISPQPGEIGWWASDGMRSRGIDSSVYVGRAEGKSFISVMRFDLSQIPRGTPLREVTLRLNGLNADRLVPEAGAAWQVDILTPGVLDDLVRTDFATLYTVPTSMNLLTLEASDLARDAENVGTFDLITTRWLERQILSGNSSLLVRISLSGTATDTLFAWDSGLGSLSTGRGPDLIFSLGGEASTPQPPVIITPTPQPENVLTAASQSLAATAEAERIGTPTPLPYYIMVATPTVTPMVVTSTPTAENAETVIAISSNATAMALTTGTFTPTPLTMITATPTPPATATAIPPLMILVTELPPTLTPTATPTPPSVIPQELIGQILFWRSEDEDKRKQLYALNPTTGDLALLGQNWPYELARAKETRSPDGQYRVIVQENLARVPQVKVYDTTYNVARDLTATTGWSFDPVWSPQGDSIAFVSQEPGNDEIYVIAADGSNMRRLTENSWEWDKHPTWSPDGNQIVFWSNRESGRRQLWVMDKDGGNQRVLLNSAFNDWDPIWVK